MDAITSLDACAPSRAIHAREVSCREVMNAYLDRIAALNPRCNAIVSLRPRATLLDRPTSATRSSPQAAGSAGCTSSRWR